MPIKDTVVRVDSVCGPAYLVLSNYPYNLSLNSLHPLRSLHDTLTGGSLPLQANAPHPAIKHNPPSGVTGPNALNLCGSSTSRYIEPENMVIPAVNRPMASLFCGAATVVRRRTPEWMSYCKGSGSVVWTLLSAGELRGS